MIGKKYYSIQILIFQNVEDIFLPIIISTPLNQLIFFFDTFSMNNK